MVLVSLVTAFAAFADEKLPVLKVGTEVYSNVTVTSVSETEIFFTHSRGMGNAKLKNLDPAMQQHFHYDAGKANAIEQKRKEANAKFVFRQAPANPNTNPPPDAVTEAKADLADAIAKVTAIINQPVTQYPKRDDLTYARYVTWFHEGATVPDFKTVDVRQTQDTKYGEDQYVVCDLNPGVYFLGADLEFNSKTKYFYTDRNLPKKKLTPAEMNEVNRLYRLIWDAQDRLADAGVNIEWK